MADETINVQITEEIFPVIITTEEPINLQVIGEVGQPGIQGEKGDTGAIGPQGSKGDTGAQGSQGDKGEKGDTGSQGLKGDKGDTGERGLQGVQGPQGVQGTQGSQGIQGNKGDKGDKGDIGLTGPSGSSNWTDLIDGPVSTPSSIDTSVEATEKFLTNIMSSGLISGGEITINSDNTKIDIAAGTGVIVNNYTDPAHPVRTFVSWNTKTAVLDPFLDASNNSSVYIDSNGDVQFLATDIVTPEKRRDIIYLGWTSHLDLATLDDVGIEPYIGQDVYNQLVDFMESFGSFNIIGNDYSFAATDLTIKKSSGKTFDASSNYINSKKSPNIYDSDLLNPVEFYYYNRSSGGLWIDNNPLITNIDPNQYDTDTGLIPVTSGYWTIQPIFFYAQYGSTDIQYGQVEYSSFEEAKSAITAPVDYDPYVADYDTFRAWLVIKQGCTDLSDKSKAVFISAGKLGLVTEASGGGQGGEINTASNLGTGLGLWRQKVGVDLQFKSLKPGSSKVTIADNLAHNEVHIDIDVSASDVPTSESGETVQDKLNDLTSLAHAAHSDDQDASEVLTKNSGESVQDKLDELDGVSHAPGSDNQVIPDQLSDLSDDSTHRLVTDTEKTTWNGKQDALGFTSVPDTRKVNGHELSSDVTVTAGDIGLGTSDSPSFAGLNITGSQSEAAILTAVDITLNATHRIIFCSGTLIVNLPTSVGIMGRAYNLINTSTGIITIQPTLAQTINGESNLTLESQYDSVVIMSDGTNWIRVS